MAGKKNKSEAKGQSRRGAGSLAQSSVSDEISRRLPPMRAQDDLVFQQVSGQEHVGIITPSLPDASASNFEVHHTCSYVDSVSRSRQCWMMLCKALAVLGCHKQLINSSPRRDTRVPSKMSLYGDEIFDGNVTGRSRLASSCCWGGHSGAESKGSPGQPQHLCGDHRQRWQSLCG